MKITKRQLRRIIKEEKARLNERVEPHAWAKAMYGTPDRDEEGQTIIYLSKDDHPTTSSFEGDLPQEWDWDETYDGLQWIVYTNQYPGGARPGDIAEPARYVESISRSKLQKIIKEEKAKLVRESITDMHDQERTIDEVASRVADGFYDSMMALFAEDPEMFTGRSTKLEWEEQVTYATQEIETGVGHAIAKVIEEIEMQLHDGAYHRGNR